MTKKQKVLLRLFLMATIMAWGPIFVLCILCRMAWDDVTNWINGKFPPT